MKAAMWIAVLLGLTALLAVPTSGTSGGISTGAGLEPTQIDAPSPTVVVAGVHTTLSATLREAVAMQPLAGENLTFALNTAFGSLLLGTTRTDPDGIAALDYRPAESGTFSVHVSFDGDSLYAPSDATIAMEVSAAPSGPSPLFLPETAILVLIVAVVGGVWATYGFVVLQVLGIRQDVPLKDRKDRRARSMSEVNHTMQAENTAEGSTMRVSRKPIASARAVSILAAGALVLAALALAFAGLSAMTPKAAPYVPTTVSFELAIVPDIQGGGWDAFVPNSLVVHQGDTVKIMIINADEMAHGFLLDAFGVNQRIEPAEMNMTTGEITPTLTTVTFVASQAGAFIFRCNVPCGDGHEYMTGTLQVLGT